MCNLFGTEILDENKKINRKKLGNIVFSSKENMDLLTDITWGYMQERIDNILNKAHELVILDWSLLPITKYWEKCDIRILVVSDENERKKKVLKRDKISKEYLEKRESKSLDYNNIKYDFVWKNDYKNMV